MAKFAVILFAAFVATLAAPQGTQENELEELTNRVQTIANDISTTLQKNLPDTKDVTETLTTQSQEFAHNIEGILKKFQTEIDNNKGKGDDILKQVSGKLSETIASIQQLAGPDATAKSTELKAQIETNIQNAAAEFEKLGKAIQPNLQEAGDRVGTFAKGVFDDFIKAAQTFQTQVETTVKN